MIIIKYVNIKKLDSNFELMLHKVSRDVIGYIPIDYLQSINRSIDNIDELELTIPSTIIDQFTLEEKPNQLYYDIKSERIISINNEEFYVIKEDDYDSDEFQKTIKAYSLEFKLSKLDIKIEDIGFYIFDKDEELGIYSLDEYMYQETGWRIGYVDESVQYSFDVELNKTPKMRWQESVNKRWYDFLMNDIAKGFACIVVFDTKNKLVNLYDVETAGEEVQIYLSMDNYVKKIGRSDSSSEIVTRLFVEGNEEMDIIGATETGYPYLENYSYFMDNDEMSKELHQAMITYESRVKEHNIQWKKIVDVKVVKETEKLDKQQKLYQVYADIKGQESLVSAYESQKPPDEINKAIAIAKIAELNDEKVILENQVKDLEDEIRMLQSSIDELNILCKRETATDENGKLIFDEYLLNELKEFVYCDTYSNDTFKDVEDLIASAKRELELKCKPTTSYTLNVVDFTKRIIDNDFRKHWNGTLRLGDVVILYDEDLNKEVFHFFTGYTLRPNENDGLDITISNKKIREDYTRTIADYLDYAERSLNMINAKKYLWNKQKYNRINL